MVRREEGDKGGQWGGKGKRGQEVNRRGDKKKRKGRKGEWVGRKITSIQSGVIHIRGHWLLTRIVD